MSQGDDVESAALAASFVGSLPADELARLIVDYPVLDLPTGRLVYEPAVSIVLAGRLRAFITDRTGRQLTVSYLPPGTAVGLAGAAGRRYPTAFQCLAPVRLLRLSDGHLDGLLRRHPHLGWAAAGEVAARLDEVEAELARVAFGSIRQRLAHHLLALMPDGSSERGTVHQADLAAAVGTVREVIARALVQLRQAGWVSSGPDGITVTDRDALISLAQEGA